HLRLSQLRILAHQTHGASHGNLAPAAERKAVDSGDDRLPQVLNQIKDILPAMRIFLPGNRVLFRQFTYIGAGNECLLTGTGEDDDTNCGVVLDVMKRSPQFFHGGHVERIEDLRAVDGDVSDGVFLFEKYVFEVHKNQSHPSVILSVAKRIVLRSRSIPFNSRELTALTGVHSGRP